MKNRRSNASLDVIPQTLEAESESLLSHPFWRIRNQSTGKISYIECFKNYVTGLWNSPLFLTTFTIVLLIYLVFICGWNEILHSGLRLIIAFSSYEPMENTSYIEEISKKSLNSIYHMNSTELAYFLSSKKYMEWLARDKLEVSSEALLYLWELDQLVSTFLSQNNSLIFTNLATFVLQQYSIVDGKVQQKLDSSCATNSKYLFKEFFGNTAPLPKGNEKNSAEFEACKQSLVKENRFKGRGTADPREVFLFCSNLFFASDRGGFLRATGHIMEERESVRPMDDISLIKLRYQTLKSSFSSDSGSAGAESSSLIPNSVEFQNTERLMMQKGYEGSSILNRRYYYPIRRFTKIQPYTLGAYAETSAWEEAISLFFGSDDKYAFDVPFLGGRRLEGIKNTFKEPQVSILPQNPAQKEKFSAPSIFVNIASYRDTECFRTVSDVFMRAHNPFRVYVGVAQQHLTKSNTNYSDIHDQPCIAPEMRKPMLVYHPFNEEEIWGVNNSTDLKDISCWSENCRRNKALSDEAVRFSKTIDEKSENSKMGCDKTNVFCRYIRGIFVPEENIRIRKFDPLRAKGPTLGRFIGMLLYQGEDFLIVIDSHLRFVPHWDVMGGYWLHQYKDPKTVLSHYPPGMKDYEQGIERTNTAYLCRAVYLHTGLIRLKAIGLFSPNEFDRNQQYNLLYENRRDALSSSDSSELPETMFLGNKFHLPQPWVAGGFLFGPGKIMREVPFDPHLPQLFDGEEMLFSVRLWTHGYNLYSPPRPMAFHFYKRSTAPKLWSDNPTLWYSQQRKSLERVQYIVRARFNGSDINNLKGGQLRHLDEISNEDYEVSNVTEHSSLSFLFSSCLEEEYMLCSSQSNTCSISSFSESAHIGLNLTGNSQILSIPSCPSTNRSFLTQQLELFDSAYQNKKALSPNIKIDLLRYGLGKKRSLSDWYDYAGVDPAMYTVQGRWCGVK